MKKSDEKIGILIHSSLGIGMLKHIGIKMHASNEMLICSLFLRVHQKVALQFLLPKPLFVREDSLLAVKSQRLL